MKPGGMLFAGETGLFQNGTFSVIVCNAVAGKHLFSGRLKAKNEE